MTEVFKNVKSLMVGLLDISLLFIAIGVVWQILFGADNSWYFGHVTENMMSLVNNFGSQGVAGVIAMLILLYIFTKSSKA